MSDTANTRAGALLREAARVVDGPRNATHGQVERSFTAIAEMWTAYINAKPEVEMCIELTAADVAAMMTLLKVCRSLHGKHIEDHGVDAAGYIALWGELRESGS